jgi:hypothetical protein
MIGLESPMGALFVPKAQPKSALAYLWSLRESGLVDENTQSG